MGLFGPNLAEKIRRSAAAAYPQAEWKMDVDWNTGSKLHQLHGTLAEQRTDDETMSFAHEVWKNLTGQYRLNPEDGRDGLLDVFISAGGGAELSTGING